MAMDADDETLAPGTLTTLAVRRETLERRLEDGYRRIDAAIAAGEDVERWETFWIDLLRQYESLFDEHELAA